MKTTKAANKNRQNVSDRIDGLALCLMHLEEETRQEGLEFTALLIRAAAESLSYPDQKPMRSLKT